jgi:hypothetical protein
MTAFNEKFSLAMSCEPYVLGNDKEIHNYITVPDSINFDTTPYNSKTNAFESLTTNLERNEKIVSTLKKKHLLAIVNLD